MWVLIHVSLNSFYISCLSSFSFRKKWIQPLFLYIISSSNDATLYEAYPSESLSVSWIVSFSLAFQSLYLFKRDIRLVFILTNASRVQSDILKKKSFDFNNNLKFSNSLLVRVLLVSWSVDLMVNNQLYLWPNTTKGRSCHWNK